MSMYDEVRGCGCMCGGWAPSVQTMRMLTTRVSLAAWRVAVRSLWSAGVLYWTGGGS